MKRMNETIELLAPAGNFEKLKVALRFGADAVYLGGKDFSLRSFADNFTQDELCAAVEYAHARGKKVYVTANIFAKNADFSALADEEDALPAEASTDGVHLKKDYYKVWLDYLQNHIVSP